MSPRRVLAEHSSRDLSDWQAFEVAFGFDTPSQGDLRAGMIAAVGTKIDERPATPADFFPRLADPEDVEPDDDEPEDVDEDEAEAATRRLKAMFGAWGRAHNARVRKRGG